MRVLLPAALICQNMGLIKYKPSRIIVCSVTDILGRYPLLSSGFLAGDIRFRYVRKAAQTHGYLDLSILPRFNCFVERIREGFCAPFALHPDTIGTHDNKGHLY